MPWLCEVFAEFLDLRFDFGGFGGGGFGEAEADEVAGSVGGDGAVVGDVGDGADGDLAGAAVEAEVDAVAAFCVQFNGSGTVFGAAPGDFAAESIVDCKVFEGLFDDGQELCDDVEVPWRGGAIG